MDYHCYEELHQISLVVTGTLLRKAVGHSSVLTSLVASSVSPAHSESNVFFVLSIILNFLGFVLAGSCPCLYSFVPKRPNSQM